MSAVLIVLGVLLLVVIVLGLWVAGIYNSLVSLRNRFKNAFAQIDVQLKRRYDLIPNLVEVAKGYMKHESSTLEAVIKARNVALAASQSAAAGYFVQAGRLKFSLPAFLTPGALTVTHTDLGSGEFQFTLEIVHPRFGMLVRQSAVFREATP